MIDLYQDYAKKSDIEKERINDDIVFEIELIKQDRGQYRLYLDARCQISRIKLRG